MTDRISFVKGDLDFIRGLKDFDLKMLISEIDEHGWEKATSLIPLIRKTLN
tara:strand:+ start:75 stop:227 length:153 start_codon:yes stop_codon:yes gene_type:complete